MLRKGHTEHKARKSERVRERAEPGTESAGQGDITRKSTSGHHRSHPTLQRAPVPREHFSPVAAWPGPCPPAHPPPLPDALASSLSRNTLSASPPTPSPAAPSSRPPGKLSQHIHTSFKRRLLGTSGPSTPHPPREGCLSLYHCEPRTKPHSSSHAVPSASASSTSLRAPRGRGFVRL